VIVPIFALMQGIFQVLLAVIAVFLILLILVQRGRGGGLAGALGGMGGSSAFGAKAGDIFTRITIGVAAVWILTCIAAATMGPSSSGNRIGADEETTSTLQMDIPAEGEEKSDAASETKPGEAASAAGDTEAKTEAAPADSKAASADSKPADAPAADEAKAE
jgi:preprotein translocase subunit SecG